MFLRLIALLVIVLNVSATSIHDPNVPSTLIVQGMAFTLHQSHSFKELNSKIQNAVIIIHGSTRDAKTYYASMSGMVGKQGLAENTLVVSPHFKEEKDSLAMNEPYWADDGWLRGDSAINANELSSFTILDRVIENLADTEIFPNLKTITITGHSDGAQLTQRYAFATSVELSHPLVQFKYVVANPGTLLYISSDRPNPSHETCSEQNHYKYGLEELNPYLKQNELSTLITRFIHKKIIYLSGEADTGDYDLDMTCAGMAQGENRFDRSKKYKEQLDKLFPDHQQKLMIIPGVGHTQHGIYHSEAGLQALFANP